MMIKKRNTKNITFVIHPTEYNDFDVLGIGDYQLLKTFVKKNEYSHLIKKSKFGGISILILNTCDNLKDAKECIKQYKKEWTTEK